MSWLPLVLLIGCASTDSGPAAKPEAAVATPAAATATPAPTPPARPLPPDEPGLGDHFLVIVASKLDPAEAEAALGGARSVPGTHARLILSSRYKNLMPCYTVAIADGLADKKAALALSKQLTAAGVDNYVKNAGAYVGASAALDAFCAGPLQTDDAGDQRFVTVAGGRAFLPVDGEVPAVIPLPPPAPLGDGYRAWIQPLPATGSQVNETGKRWTVVDVKSGKVQVCTETSLTVLTLGTPHFGLLQAPEPPTEPSCGAPALFAELDCALDAGLWLAVAQVSPTVWTAGAPGGETQLAAVQAELAAEAAWTDFSGGEGDEVRREVNLVRYAGPSGAVWAGGGSAESGPGICGGDEITLRGVWAAGDQGLGRRLGDWMNQPFSELEGLVDVDGDGVPEIVWSEFPDGLHLSRVDGSDLTHFEVAFCDCAC